MQFLKKDSSITRGFEIVSAPASYDEHMRLWNKFFEEVPRETVKPEPTCGMHVHVGRTRLTHLSLGKILRFVHGPNNRDFITAIAGRPSSYHNDFTKPKKLTDGKNGGFCQVDMDRHTAVNCNNKETIEFRIFQATLEKETFLKNIQFCRGLVKYTECGNCALSDVESHKGFCEFISNRKKEYSSLYNFLQSKKFCATMKKPTRKPVK